MKPTPNGHDGRDRRGRFAFGNAGGPGNPNARTAHKWRERLACIVTDDDFDAIVRRMVADAVGGDKDARNQLLDRLCGKAGPVRDEEMDSDEHKIIYIRRIMAMGENLPPGAVPGLQDDGNQ